MYRDIRRCGTQVLYFGGLRQFLWGRFSLVGGVEVFEGCGGGDGGVGEPDAGQLVEALKNL